MTRLGSQPLSSGLIFLCALAVCLSLAAGTAAGSPPLASSSVGVDFSGLPANLSTAAAAGVGVARQQVIAGSDTDRLVQLTAAARLRLYPMLGLPRSEGPATDASAMAQFVTSFAQRYGPRGSFWKLHPELPYLPVLSYEIGNEPDITPTDPADETSLHYADPAAFAQVYETARSALHSVDPTALAVVGGVLDSGSVPLTAAERYLRAVGPADAIGYHPYLYDLATMERHTLALRRWLNANHKSGVPLNINEFGSFVDPSGALPGIASWGRQVAKYTEWALCTSSLGVTNVQAFWWGGVPGTDSDVWFSMFSAELAETALGSAYLAEARKLTTSGCPAPPARPRSKKSIGTAVGVSIGALHRRQHAKPRHSDSK